MFCCLNLTGWYSCHSYRFNMVLTMFIITYLIIWYHCHGSHMFWLTQVGSHILWWRIRGYQWQTCFCDREWIGYWFTTAVSKFTCVIVNIMWRFPKKGVPRNHPNLEHLSNYQWWLGDSNSFPTSGPTAMHHGDPLCLVIPMGQHNGSKELLFPTAGWCLVHFRMLFPPYHCW